MVTNLNFNNWSKMHKNSSTLSYSAPTLSRREVVPSMTQSCLELSEFDNTSKNCLIAYMISLQNDFIYFDLTRGNLGISLESGIEGYSGTYKVCLNQSTTKYIKKAYIVTIIA